MRNYGLSVLFASLLILPTVSFADGKLKCGIKPIPDIGCKIGRCVNGAWEQVCDRSSGVTCGIKPIPNVGCKIGRCVNGQWEQVCVYCSPFVKFELSWNNEDCKMSNCLRLKAIFLISNQV